MKIFGFKVTMPQLNTKISTLSVCIRSWQMILIYLSSAPTGAPGHGKGAIDAISSFGAKNILRHNIITQDIFLNDSNSIVNYTIFLL